MHFLRTLLLVIIAGSFFFSCKENSEKKAVEPLTDEALLDTVQKQTLKYFWDYAEPNSGLARERFHPDDDYPKNDSNIVTTGGSGFGLMALVVGMERKFIPRDSTIVRLEQIANFLENAPRYHGVWPHWLNGKTGETKAFGLKDDGGDLVETSFLAQGFVVVREYLKNGTAEEQRLAKKYDQLLKGIEWDWYTNNKDGLYWHWSPEYEWEMDFLIEGYNECLITYIMAASSQEHGIEPSVYHKGWARSGNIVSEQKAYGIPLLLKHNTAGDKAGPLFWAHYSYLGLNPKGLEDKYAKYWDLNVNHTLINYQYTQDNPKQFETYSQNSWGLTASYTKNKEGGVGYTAHSPDNDKGVVSPTAAVSSIPYTPELSLMAVRYFFEEQHELLWGPAGFYDAFSLENKDWVADRYLAIDQGPQVVMIENYRSGLIWELFMNAPEIKKALDKLGFTY